MTEDTPFKKGVSDRMTSVKANMFFFVSYYFAIIELASLHFWIPCKYLLNLHLIFFIFVTSKE